MDGGEEGRMTLDLDALEALEKKLRERGVMSHEEARKLIRPLPELLRLARIGQRVERDAKEEGK